MSEIKLNPCPFCGGEAKFSPLWNENPADYWVRCRICGCETGCYDTQEEAAEAWNRRVDNKKTYHEMETSRADMTDFRRPPYAVQRAIRVQSEQIRETPAEYVARKCGIRSDADGSGKTEQAQEE